MAADLTPLATSMLAMLSEAPMHCYEMYRLMLHRHEDRIVKVKPGSLYHTMDRLVAAELAVAVGTERDGGRPERTTYAITDAGRAAMQQWVRGVLEEPLYEYPRFPVALAEAHTLSRPEVVQLLENRIALVQHGLDTNVALIAQAYEAGVVEVHLLDGHYQMDMMRAEISWLRRLVERLENKELEWSPKTHA